MAYSDTLRGVQARSQAQIHNLTKVTKWKDRRTLGEEGANADEVHRQKCSQPHFQYRQHPARDQSFEMQKS